MGKILLPNNILLFFLHIQPGQRSQPIYSPTFKRSDNRVWGGDGKLDKQFTFDDVSKIQIATTLSQNQKRVVALLDAGLTQGLIADRMHVSRSFVSQTVRMLEKHNLVKKQFEGSYNSFYQLSPELKTRYPIEEEPEFIHTRVHNIRRKYRILHQSHPVSLDKRLGFLKEWEMRGGKRYKFWYSGKAGEPRIQIDVQPGSLIVYPDAKQDFLAETELEAEDMANIACHNAVLRFVREQAKFGVHITIDELGKQIVPIHYGFPMPEGHPLMAGGIKSEDEWTDGSPGDGSTEYETTNRGKATALSEAIDKVKRVDSLVKESIQDAMPEAMKEFLDQFAPLRQEILAVTAFVQSGLTFQHEVQQLTFLVAKQLRENHELQDELDRAKSGKTVEKTVTATRAEPVYRSAYTAPSYEE